MTNEEQKLHAARQAKKRAIARLVKAAREHINARRELNDAYARIVIAEAALRKARGIEPRGVVL